MKLFKYAWDDYLLVEGRKDDVLNKHPWLDTEVLKYLSENDPSGNNKYLMWMADRFAETTIKMFYYEELGKPMSFLRAMFGGRFGPELAKTYFNKEQYFEGYKDKAKEQFDKYLEKPSYDGDPVYDTNVPFLVKIFYLVNRFHKLLPYMKNKDLYFYKSHMNLVDALKNAEKAYAAKKEKRMLKDAAKKGGRIIWEFGNIAVIRPLTTEASCLFGKQTKWCISASKTNNYFQEYTDRGQSFYFLFLPGATTPKWKKIALVVNPEHSWDWESIYDAEDGGMDYNDLIMAWNEARPSDFHEHKWRTVLSKVTSLMSKDADADMPWSVKAAEKIVTRWIDEQRQKLGEKFLKRKGWNSTEYFDVNIKKGRVQGQIEVEAEAFFEFPITKGESRKTYTIRNAVGNNEIPESVSKDRETKLIKRAINSINDSLSRLAKGESLPGPAPQIPTEISNSLLHYKVSDWTPNLITFWGNRDIGDAHPQTYGIRLFIQPPELKKQVINNEEELEKFLALVHEQEEALKQVKEVAYNSGDKESYGVSRLLLPGLAEEGIT
tara:strand:+ start:514 stop:2160 length:1647 start_codon:yes stop_codon:yes gene_type:complete